MSKNHQESGAAVVRRGTRHTDVLAPNTITILTILTILAAGWQFKALQTPVEQVARGADIYTYIGVGKLR